MNKHLEDNIDLFCRNEIEDALLKLKERNKNYADLLNKMDIIENEFDDFLENDEDTEKIKILKEYIWLTYKRGLIELDTVYRQGIRDGITLNRYI